MVFMDIIIFGLLALLVIVLLFLVNKNSKLHEENKKLNEILEMKDTTISNYKASRVAVSDVIENFSSLEDVMKLIHEGMSKSDISKKLNIAVSKIELIIKFDTLKKKKI